MSLNNDVTLKVSADIGAWVQAMQSMSNISMRFQKDSKGAVTGAHMALTEAGKAKTTLASLFSQFSMFPNMMKPIFGALKGVATTFLAIGTAATGLGALLVNKLTPAFKAVEEYNLRVVRSASVLASIYADAGPGSDITKVYQKAYFYADKLQETMIKINKNTLANVAQMNLVNLELNKQGITVDVNSEKSIKGFETLTNAIAVMTAGMQNQNMQFGQEIRAVLEGNIRQGSTLALFLKQKLGPNTKQIIEEWKRSGTFLENVSKHLKGFDAASSQIKRTWETVNSTFKSLIEYALAKGFKPMYNYIIDIGLAINEYISNNLDGIIARIHAFSTSLVNVFKFLTESNMFSEFTKLGKTLMEAGNILKPVLSMYTETIKDAINSKLFSDIGASIRGLIIDVANLAKTLLEVLLPAFKTVGEFFGKTFNIIIQEVSGILEKINDTIRNKIGRALTESEYNQKVSRRDKLKSELDDKWIMTDRITPEQKYAITNAAPAFKPGAYRKAGGVNLTAAEAYKLSEYLQLKELTDNYEAQKLLTEVIAGVKGAGNVGATGAAKTTDNKVETFDKTPSQIEQEAKQLIVAQAAKDAMLTGSAAGDAQGKLIAIKNMYTELKDSIVESNKTLSGSFNSILENWRIGIDDIGTVFEQLANAMTDTFRQRFFAPYKDMLAGVAALAIEALFNIFDNQKLAAIAGIMISAHEAAAKSFAAAGGFPLGLPAYALSLAQGLSSAAVVKAIDLKLNGYAVGTDFVPEDQLAYIHKGEMIIPAAQSEGIRSGNSILGDSNISDKLDMLIAISAQNKYAIVDEAGLGSLTRAINKQNFKNGRYALA
jgi:hypothetical protein